MKVLKANTQRITIEFSKREMAMVLTALWEMSKALKKDKEVKPFYTALRRAIENRKII